MKGLCEDIQAKSCMTSGVSLYMMAYVFVNSKLRHPYYKNRPITLLPDICTCDFSAIAEFEKSLESTKIC